MSATPARGFDKSVVFTALPVIALLPAWFVSIVVIWLPIAAFTEISLLQFTLVAFLSSGLVFLRTVQSVILTRLIGTRAPTPSEIARLEAPWKAVLQANHQPRSKFLITILDSDEVNAFACGGHLVVVSSFALQYLPEAELRGVLAHELSHHLGSHTVLLAIGQWLSVPIIVLGRIGLFFQHLAEAATRTLGGSSPALEMVGIVIAAFVRLVSMLFLSTLTISQKIGNLVGRNTEYDADSRVVRMGFGRDLANALRLIGGESRDSTSWRENLVTSHPPAKTRIVRIEALVKQRPA
jgi:Zn-dependent protease with chaperone function